MTGRARLPIIALCLALALAALSLCAAGAAGSEGRHGGRSHAVKLRRATPKTKSPAHGQTVSGQIKWRVRVRGARPKRVDFVIDRKVKVRRARRTRRGTATIDTEKLSNGPHTLTAIAYGRDGRRSGKSKGRVRVANAANGPSSVYWGAA